MREAALCLYLSEKEREEYLAQGADPARLAPMPPPLDLPEPPEVPRADEPTVVYLGQLHPIKRIDVLLEAFELVQEALPEARLEVIGAQSKHGEELRARAGEGVTFRGRKVDMKQHEHKFHADCAVRAFGNDHFNAA